MLPVLFFVDHCTERGWAAVLFFGLQDPDDFFVGVNSFIFLSAIPYVFAVLSADVRHQFISCRSNIGFNVTEVDWPPRDKPRRSVVCMHACVCASQHFVPLAQNQ